MTSVPSVAQIRAQVESIRDRYPDARAIGIRMPALDEATPARPCCGSVPRSFLSSNAGSVLALRERLVNLSDAGPPSWC